MNAEKNQAHKNRKGRTFYTSVPMALTARTTSIAWPVSREKVLPFVDSLVLFFFGMAETLLALRFVMMVLGINGGNLLTFLFYAASYPFVLIGGSSQKEVPAMTLNSGIEMLIIMAVYGIIWLALARVIGREISNMESSKQ